MNVVLKTPGHSKDFNPSDVSYNFRLMGATFEGKLNQSDDRNAERDVGVEILSVTKKKRPILPPLSTIQ